MTQGQPVYPDPGTTMVWDYSLNNAFQHILKWPCFNGFFFCHELDTINWNLHMNYRPNRLHSRFRLCNSVCVDLIMFVLFKIDHITLFAFSSHTGRKRYAVWFDNGWLDVGSEKCTKSRIYAPGGILLNNLHCTLNDYAMSRDCCCRWTVNIAK